MPQIAGVHPIALDFVNAVLLETPGGRVLVDTGLPYTTDTLLAELERTGGMPDLVVLTHAHGDHIGGLGALGGIPIAAHETDADLLAEGRQARPMVPAPHCPDHLLEMLKAGEPPRIDPVQVDIRLADGDTVPGHDGLVAIHTPGHSAGHIALLWKQGGGVLITGDAAANQGALMGPPVGEDLELADASLRRLAEMDFEAAVFGHGETIASGASAAFAAVWSPASA
jgi:glyoxylase-like metal-dependent hydrolase (beta-lactamase superfamily II)